jgi:hypothetical protein
MDLEILKRKLSTYKNAKGSFRNLEPEVLVELLAYWEIFNGSRGEFCKGVGIKAKQMGSLLREAKKAKRNSGSRDFKEVIITEDPSSGSVVGAIEFIWADKIIRFQNVEQLAHFLKIAS